MLNLKRIHMNNEKHSFISYTTLCIHRLRDEHFILTQYGIIIMDYRLRGIYKQKWHTVIP